MNIGAGTIERWHNGRGFNGIGYHYVIRRNGAIEPGRPLSAIGAHVRDYNSRSVGICLVGGVDSENQPENNFTDAQFETLQIIVELLGVIYPTALILGHRDFRDVDKACPSFDVREWQEFING
jgi:N-acetyl-anhydromuramyl-L-alanine amidase AmpD